MAKPNLKSMSVHDLVVLRDRVQAELSRKVGEERGALQKQIDALATLEGVATGAPAVMAKRGHRAETRTSATSATKKVDPKYRGPDGSTWTGRGRAPRWLVELEGAGKKRESYLIKT